MDNKGFFNGNHLSAADLGGVYPARAPSRTQISLLS